MALSGQDSWQIVVVLSGSRFYPLEEEEVRGEMALQDDSGSGWRSERADGEGGLQRRRALGERCKGVVPMVVGKGIFWQSRQTAPAPWSHACLV